jgi:hypothetical protein
MAVALIFPAFIWVFILPIGPSFPVGQMLALPANVKGFMVRALSAGRIAAKLTFAVDVPIAAVSAKLTLTGPGTYTGFFINPISAFSIFPAALIDTPAAIFAVNIIRVLIG